MGNETVFGRQNFIGRTNESMEKKYAIQTGLGEGAYGRVYKVQNRFTKEIFACKEIPKTALSEESEFQKEIELLIACDHPNIIKLYEVYETDNFIRLVMEICTGGELFDRLMERIDAGTAFTEREAANIFKQMMSAVNYCHARKITHRDLKPENLLLLNKDLNSPIKVIDFGMSKIYSDNEILKERVGTAYYISPEVIEGSYDEKCDIWSAGVILYVLLSGDPPFNGEDDEEILESVKMRKYDFPSDKWNYISEDAKDLIKKMLCPPDERLSAEQVLQHPWVENLAPKATDVDLASSLKEIKKNSTMNRFKKAVITYIASRMNDKDVEQLKKNFQAMDKNGDGMLSLEEIKSAVSQNKGISMKNIEELFYSIDTDHSGNIDYTEFISASLKENDYMKEERLRDAFNAFDLDKSGKISKQEVASVLKTQKDSNYITDLFKKYDLNGDGEIDFPEFLNMMKSMTNK